MVDFEWDPDNVPLAKLILHCSQILLAFVAWCLEIAVFNDSKASIVGDNGWTFAVFFLYVPAWIYLIGTPRFERTRKYANPVAMFAVDVVCTILALSAFASQASYNSKDLCGTRCGISKSIVAIGVLVTLLWAGSAFVSGYTMTYSNFHGSLPGYDNRKIRTGGDNSIDPDKEAFSMAPHGDEAYERVHMEDHEQQAGGYGGSHYDQDDPNRYGSLPPRGEEMFDATKTAYHGATSMPYEPSQVGGTYTDEPAKFPNAPYDRVDR